MPGPQDKSDTLDRLRRLWPAIIVLFAAVHLYCSPARVAELEVVPDSVEYAVAAHRFATTGHYEIVVNGRSLPPRYPPGFSVLFLAPIYAIAPGNIGNGIVIVWVAAILAALFAYLIGNRVAGPWGGTLAAVALLHHPQFADYSQVIMTDVPAVALGLAACWLYLRIRKLPQPSRWLYFAAGMIVAGAVALRPLMGVLALPFLLDLILRRLTPSPPYSGEKADFGELSRAGVRGDASSGAASKIAPHPNPLPRVRGRVNQLLSLACIIIPSVIIMAGTSFQQWYAFGNWRRTGYQFWLAVPYDYLSLTFSPRYLKDNLLPFQRNLLWVPIVFGGIGMLALWKKRSVNLWPAVIFLLLTALPLSLIHSFYFFTDVRFHLFGIALLCVLAGGGIAALIPENARQKGWMLLPILALTIFLPRLRPNPFEEGPPFRHDVASICNELLPKNAILISGIDPAYLEQMVARGTSRRIIPIDKNTHYATSVLTWTRIPKPNPPPKNAGDQSCTGLRNGGAEKLYEFTADESPDRLQKWIKSGRPVYLELKSREADDRAVANLRKSFRFVPVSSTEPWLVRLSP